MQADGGRARGIRVAATLVLSAGVLLGGHAVSAGAQGPGRAYELISPVDKNLGDVLRVPPAADDGDTIPFAATAATDGAAGVQNAAYTVARRSPGGWLRTDANAPTVEAPPSLATTIADQFSRDFSALIVDTEATLDPGDRDEAVDLYRVTAGAGSATWLSRGATVPDASSLGVGLVWASADLAHVVFSGSGAGQLLPDAGPSSLYELRDGTLRLVGYTPGSGTPASNVLAPISVRDRSGFATRGSGTAVPHGGAHPVSDDGRRIFFGLGGSINALQLYVREDGVRTIPISVSERAGTAGTIAAGRFIAADPEGEVAYFTSGTQLTDDAPAGTNVYRFSRLDDPGSRLRLITPVGGTISSALASADGRTLYFVSTAALAPGAVQGQRNAYRWSGGQLGFVATVGSTGSVARVSRDGRYAVLASSASLGGAPNAGRPALYLHDGVAGTLACASCRPDGTPSAGAANLDAQPLGTITPGLTAPRNLTDDGRLYFASTDRLVAEDGTDAADVYEYDHGVVRLISSGDSAYDSYVADNSDDGTSVFFTTRAPLVPQDVDNGVLDLYVARTGGGFPPPAAPGAPCAEDACQGPLPPPVALPAPGSATAGPSGNVTPPAAAARSVQLLRPSAAARRRLARTGAATIGVRVSGGGVLVVRAVARGRTVASARRTLAVTEPRTARVRLRLSARARRGLRRAGALRLRLETSVRGTTARDTLTLTLRAPR